ncbi:hypothetical protein EST38_g229 [Candolleomyces aberdarensis]|uniref:F-box domain-containing protein n=1 Tax=Candolleomyces aberdarensis TaxID=2316362 RepID=A0A4Q2DZ02_9AGAR|nr:hypothetical protein EST38_g229 [Candolleomyces aberdarensis]
MDSPFSEYMVSGCSPSDAEIPLIKALIQQKIDVIDSIDKEIKEVLDSLAALKARRKANKIFIRKHQALIAPIKRLPPDILSTVFLACLPVIECMEAAMTCNHPAVVISQVCRHWRQLAFDTPLLWSRIQLILPNVNCDPYQITDEVDRMNGETAALFDSVVQRLFDTTTTWLGRSKGCPLTIFMKASESAAGGLDTSQLKTLEGSVLTGLGKLVGLLLSESKRWEQVRFELAIIGNSRKSQLSRLLFLAPRDVPILRKTSIVINSVDVLGVPISPGVGSEHTNFWDGIAMSTIHGQALQSLTLACPKNATKLKGLQVNWDGLTELSLRPFTLGSGWKGVTHLTADEALTLLRLCPNLKRCNLAIGNGSFTSDWGPPLSVWNPLTTPLAVAPVQDDRPVCRLPHLHSLILREDSGRTDSLASALELPSLRSFTQMSPIQWSRPPQVGMPTSYQDPEDERAWNAIPLVVWVQRFGHAITSIDIKLAGVPQHDVEKCLEDLPNLVSLTIRSPFSESWNATSPWGIGTCDSFLKRLTPEVTEDGDTVTVTPGCLCPKLEDLALNPLGSVPAQAQLMFNEAIVLEFLTGRAKASSKTVPEVNRVSKLRYVRAGLVDQKVVDIEQELSRRGCNMEGFVGEWNYPAPSIPRSYLETPHISNFAMDEF